MSQLEEWTNGELKQAVNEGLKETAAAAEKAFEAGRTVHGENREIYQGLDA